MTIAEHEEVAQIERTCEEIRNENAALRDEIQSMRKVLEEVYKLNCLGKTQKLALIVDEVLFPNRKRTWIQ